MHFLTLHATCNIMLKHDLSQHVSHFLSVYMGPGVVLPSCQFVAVSSTMKQNLDIAVQSSGLTGSTSALFFAVNSVMSKL